MDTFLVLKELVDIDAADVRVHEDHGLVECKGHDSACGVCADARERKKLLTLGRQPAFMLFHHFLREGFERKGPAVVAQAGPE